MRKQMSIRRLYHSHKRVSMTLIDSDYDPSSLFPMHLLTVQSAFFLPNDSQGDGIFNVKKNQNVKKRGFFAKRK